MDNQINWKKDIDKEYNENYSDRKRMYREIIDGEVSYLIGYPPKKVGFRYFTPEHGFVEVKKIRVAFDTLEVICEKVK